MPVVMSPVQADAFCEFTYEHTFPSSNLGRAVGNRSQSTSSSTGTVLVMVLSTCVVHFCSGVFIAEAMWRWRHGRCARSDVMVTSRAATGTCDSPSRRARNLQTTRERRLFANKASEVTTLRRHTNLFIIIIIIPAKASLRGDYVITGVRLSVRLSVCYHDN